MITAERAPDELDNGLALLRLEPAILVADLVLLGFALDTQAQCGASLAQVLAQKPECALANARVAIESAQQAMVLATHSDYTHARVQGWVYFAGKESELAAMAHPAPNDAKHCGERVRGPQKAAGAVHPQSAILFDRAEVAVSQLPRRPDSRLGLDTAKQYEEGSARVLSALGRAVPTHVGTTERLTYKALCSGAHASPRLRLKGIAKLKNGRLFCGPRHVRRCDIGTSCQVGDCRSSPRRHACTLLSHCALSYQV